MVRHDGGGSAWQELTFAAHGVERGVYYTAGKAGAPNAGAVYAFAMEWPDDNKLVLTQPVVGAGASARMLGCDSPVAIEALPGNAAGAPGAVVTIPALTPKQLPSFTGPWVLELTGVQ